MKRHRMLFLWIASLSIATQSLATVDPETRVKTSSTQNTERSKETASARYRQELINALATRNDADALLSAALLAKIDAFCADKDLGQDAAISRYTELLQRAQQAAPEKPLIWWIAALPDAWTKNNLRHDALEKLKVLAPNNAAIWLLDLPLSTRDLQDNPTLSATLAQAANATEYNEYFGELSRALLQAIAILPVPAELLQDDLQGSVNTAESLRITLSLSVIAALENLPYQTLVTVCKTEKQPTSDRNKNCMTIAQKMENSGTLLSGLIGTAIEKNLVAGTNPKAEAAVDKKKRNYLWQQERYAALERKLLEDPTKQGILSSLYMQSHSEIEFIASLLKQANESLEAPEDWQPKQRN